MSQPPDRERAKEVISSALGAMERKEGLFENGPYRPEEAFIDLIKEHSAEIDDERFLVNTLFLSTSLVFGSDVGNLFDNLSDREAFNKYKYVFDPFLVVCKDEKDLIVDLVEYIRPGGYQVRAIKQWMHNCQILVNKFHGDTREFFDTYVDDANILKELLKAKRLLPPEEIPPNYYVPPRIKDKKDFRRYGPKLIALLMQWIGQYEIYHLKHLDLVGVPADFHFGAIVLGTGIATIDGEEIAYHRLLHDTAGPFINEILREMGVSTKDLSEAFYTIGVLGCNKNAHDRCPIAGYCRKKIIRDEYDSRGVFSLKTAIDWRTGKKNR